MSNARMLFVDIETSPNLAYVWRMFKENVSLPQLIESTKMISFAAKWHKSPRTMFYSDFHDDHETMVAKAYDLIDKADIVVHYNGKSFDMPHMNREFLQAGFDGPPSPVKQIDLLSTVRKRFRFASNKLDHVTQALGQGGKVQHTGFDLWRRCMANDPEAWALMKEYNMGDVTELEEFYERVKPWIISHPHLGLYDDEAIEDGADICSRCGSDDLIRKGYAYTNVSKFQRFKCRDCGGWSRGKSAVARVEARGLN